MDTTLAKTNGYAHAAPDIQLEIGGLFRSKSMFDQLGRMSNAFAQSTIIPKDYQKSPANCMIALEMSLRIGTSPMMVMQNLYIVNGRPAWSSQFIIAMINNSKKYKTELQYEISGSGDSLQCYAYVIDHNDCKIAGPTIDMKMAKAEGWLDKNGSKWKTMPEVMIRYRSASFFGRLHCPDMIMGIYSADEVIEMPDNSVRYVESPQYRPDVDMPSTDSISWTTENTMNNTLGVDQLPSNDTDENEQYPDDSDHTDEAALITGQATLPEPAMPVNGQAPVSDHTVSAPNGSGDSNGNQYICADCGTRITAEEHNYAIRNFNRPLCRKHQQDAKLAARAGM